MPVEAKKANKPKPGASSSKTVLSKPTAHKSAGNEGEVPENPAKSLAKVRVSNFFFFLQTCVLLLSFLYFVVGLVIHFLSEFAPMYGVVIVLFGSDWKCQFGSGWQSSKVTIAATGG